MNFSTIPFLAVGLQILFVAFTSTAAAQTTTVLYNGWDSGFVSGNSTVFAAAYFSPAELADPLVSGEEADADNDGDSNIEEYFRLGDPTVPHTGTLLAIIPGGATTDCSFTGLSRPVGLAPCNACLSPPPARTLYIEGFRADFYP
jgi:hypothetical protein